MKKILATAMLCISTFIANAQVIPSAYDSAQDARIEKIQMHLERFSTQHASGATLLFVGLGASLVGGITGSDPILVGGGMMSVIGGCMMISAPRHVGKAARVGREKIHYNL